MHDLISLYARELGAEEPAGGARRRLLDHYLTAAASADALLRPTAKRVVPEVGAVVEPVTFTDADTALDWLESEGPNLLALIDAWRDTHPRACWQLAVNLAGWLERRASRTTWAEVMRSALAAAEADDAPGGQALILNRLAVALSHLREIEAALDAYAGARRLNQRLGDRYQAATALANTGSLYSDIGDPQSAVPCLEMALDELAGLPGADTAIRSTRLNLAYAYRWAGYHDKALALNEDVLAEAIAAADDDIVCNTRVNIGALHRLAGAFDEATREYEEALRLARELRYRMYERWALHGLALTLRDRHSRDAAAAMLAEVVTLYREAGDPGAEVAQRELDEMLAQP